jgi:diguanylate cyclase (GGDEF)-like protein
MVSTADILNASIFNLGPRCGRHAAEHGRRSPGGRGTSRGHGGDEFVIALWELSHGDGAAKLVSEVIQAVSQPYSIQGRGVSMTASVGVGIYPTHGEEVETLMKSADLALYEAKDAGKNDYRIAAHTDLLAMARS